jgi:hypothetical protein
MAQQRNHPHHKKSPKNRFKMKRSELIFQPFSSRDSDFSAMHLKFTRVSCCAGFIGAAFASFVSPNAAPTPVGSIPYSAGKTAAPNTMAKALYA